MDTSNSTHVNDRLRQERIRRNWRQRDLAEQLGTTVVTIKRWERGYQQPGSYFRDKLCALFGKNVEELGLAPIAEPEDSRLWNIPFPRNPFFTGRDLVLQGLHAALTSKPTIAALTQSYALQGLGGIGKTQLAIEYAYRYRSEYQAIFWVEAETHTSLMSSFLRLATLLELPETAAKDQRKIVAFVLRWLNRHEEWLLIFDNVEDLSLIKPFLPASDQGALLLTTRLQTLGTLAKAVPLSPMTTQEGLHFLLRRTKRMDRERGLIAGDEQEKAATQAIIAEMGGLPLALEQVGAYIDATQCRLSDYLQLFRTTQYRLLDKHEDSSDHPLSVSQTFGLAFERVEQRNPLAAALLKVCAFLAPDAIPETLFLEGASLCGSALEAMTTDPLAFPEAIKVLRSYSLIQRYPERQSLSLHRLVQAVLRQRMNEAEQEQWRQQALHLLSAAFPKGTHEIWKQCERLLPHVLTCVALVPEHREDLELSNLLQKVSIYLAERGLQYEQVEALCQRALHIRTQQLGLRHPKMAEFLSVQGRLYRYMGKYEESEAFYQQALHIYEQHLGIER
ncbi:MAG TPA: FxSxx-COOH system tetratricopeptide repeat protein, partial [Ktedonobacteraceae bacterium]|nr:FxSxx-COOH system tetratricopeptide repeat protein [Ktedonobacteraceae bacterium]